ncbi:peptidase family M1 [Seiridium cupressi]
MREVVTDKAKSPPFRLPDSIIPQHYAIEVEPNPEDGTFEGRVTIQLHVAKATQYIVFHALRLKITQVSVEPEGGIVSYPGVNYNPEQETAYLKLKTKLHAGSQALLSLNYGGQMAPTGTMGGMMPTPYQLPSGEVKLGFETMFEPILARSVFPCFDEPDLKAEFLVSLVVRSDLTCLSNMEVESENAVESFDETPKKRVVFKTSPKMSTYLVVLVAGYFNVIETNDFHVPIRVYAALDKDINSAAYALEIAVKSMKTHEKSFGLKYPLPKLDMIAVPGHQGGMEHWGCVTYEERGLILPATPSEYDKMRLALLIAHELAHQWFGNIVTMKFWDSLWLNEAFSEWAAVFAASQMLPDFDAWASFIASSPDGLAMDGFQAALDLDANVGSHAIQDRNVTAGSAFDSITYLKGCSIIRMMAENLGVDVFLQGIQLYLKRFMYGNATTEQLWDTLSEVSGRDVAGFMSAWTQKVGYPLLTVSELRPTGEIVVDQSRFLQNGERDTKIGPYPVTIQLRGPDGVTTHPLTGNKTTIRVNPFKYKLNADLVGFYRVSYPLSRIHKFGVQFAGDYLSVNDKVGIISDLGAVLRTGLPSRNTNLPEFLDFLLRIKDDIDSVFVWRQILEELGTIRAAFLFEGDDFLDILRSVKHELLAHLVAKGLLSFGSTDTIEEKFLKALIFGQLKDHPQVQKKAKAAWQQLLAGDKDALNPNIKRQIFDTVVFLDETDATWDNLKSIALKGTYIRSGDPVTPIEAFASLGSSPYPELIARSLELITPSKYPVRPSPVVTRATPFVLNWVARLSILRTLQGHPGGAEASWRWLYKNWELLHEGRKSGGIRSYAYIDVALGGLATPAHLSQVENFFADKVDSSFEMLLDQAKDRIRVKARLVAADRKELLQWAKQRSS